MDDKKKARRTNLIFAAVLLAAAGILFVVLGQRPTGSIAVLTYDSDRKTMEIPLDRDARYDIESGPYTIHLEVQDGRIRFTDSPCPDHLCEGYGWLSRDGDSAACLPAFASLVVLEQDG